ncbi:MAG: SIS domain-containing protein [Elusimicrobia bacterium]|nr:SIS domain-containing protein [Elusimicrobiota bacterium]
MLPALDIYAAALQSLLSACAATDDGARPFIFADAISAVTGRIAALRGTSNKVIAIGNGGSAAVANHFVLDLWNNSGVRAVSFADASLLTCMSNDYGYAEVFRKPIGMFADTGDVLVAVSSSGRSQNIIHAVDEARARGLWCVTMSGFKPDNPLSRNGHVNFFINSGSYGMVELAHAVLCHYLSDILAEK